MQRDILLIGGSNIDFIANPFNKIIRKVSNIGKINVSFGGVMRNTTENLARLGNKCTFLTALGNDILGSKLRENLLSLGVTVYSPTTTENSSLYIALNDVNKDLDTGICDNSVINSLDSSFIEKNNEIIESHEFIIIDANLPQETIDYLFEKYFSKKFICEAISPEKVKKYKNHLDKIYLLKCNIFEAQSLINIKLVEKDLVGALLAKGIGNVVVSNKSNDIYFGKNRRDIGLVHVEKIEKFVNTTGCGDALFAGIVDHFLRGETLKKSIEFGNNLAKVTLMSEKSVSPDISNYFYNHND